MFTLCTSELDAIELQARRAFDRGAPRTLAQVWMHVRTTDPAAPQPRSLRSTRVWDEFQCLTMFIHFVSVWKIAGASARSGIVPDDPLLGFSRDPRPEAHEDSFSGDSGFLLLSGDLR